MFCHWLDKDHKLFDCELNSCSLMVSQCPNSWLLSLVFTGGCHHKNNHNSSPHLPNAVPQSPKRYPTSFASQTLFDRTAPYELMAAPPKSFRNSEGTQSESSETQKTHEDNEMMQKSYLTRQETVKVLPFNPIEVCLRGMIEPIEINCSLCVFI